ncbi:MAG: carotenoid synthesis regulator CarF [Sphingomonadales bacterium]|nr:carotenoid synthesis regulator CarF [Sphingomonadales bacterium]MDE2570634.1 carotenoid synthesis regulator CarF [Sphingomonadales bacterium]
MLRQRLLLLTFLLSLAGIATGAVLAAGWFSLPALIAGWYAADMLSGLIHMIMDYRPCPPGMGLADIFFYTGSRESEEYVTMQRARMARLNAFERISYDFKNHHPRPDALGRRPLWRLVGSTIIAGALPMGLSVNLAQALLPVPGWALAFAFSLLAGGAFAQYFHGSLHRKANPWFIGAMRKVGLLMTPAEHQLHHDTLQRDFATNCGWSNPVINRLFKALRARGYLDSAGLEPTS